MIQNNMSVAPTFFSVAEANGWKNVSAGYYKSGNSIKPVKDFAVIARKTEVDTFLKKVSNRVSSNPAVLRDLNGGQSGLWERPKSSLTPVDAAAHLPVLSNFDNYLSLVTARPGGWTLVISFDSEWDVDTGITLTWQFAVIWKNYLYEIVFTRLGNKNLEFEYAMGRILDYLGLQDYAVDIRKTFRYSYCNELDHGIPVVINGVTDVREARSNARYIYRKQTFEPVLISDMPDRNMVRHDRDWAWFHRYNDYSKVPKLSVTLLCHTGRVDVRNFGNDGGVWLLRRCSDVQGGLTTIEYPIMVTPRSSEYVTNGYGKTYVLSISLRDTMCHAPAGMKSLESLGNVVGIPKIDVPNETKAHMFDFIAKDPAGFLEYASRDAVTTLFYGAALYGINSIIPVTLTSAAASVARQKMMEVLGVNDVTEFNKKYRGLQKVSHGLTPRQDRPGYLESSSFEPISDKANTVQYYASQSYHGGYNGCSMIGWYDGITTYDYDLKNAYPTAMCLVPDIDWDDPILGGEIINRELRLSDFRNSQTGMLNSVPLFFAYVRFRFRDNVLFPCLPVTVDGVPIYPISSDGINGVYVCGPEVVLALQLGCEVFCERGFFLRSLFNEETGSVSYSLRAAVRQLVADRDKAKREIGPKSLEEQTLKTMVNSLYGKNAQNVIEKHSWSAYKQEMETLGASGITNPVSAAITTSIVRAVLLAAQNQAVRLGYHAYSVTTDGGIFDVPEDVMTMLDLYGLRQFMEQSRLYLTDGKNSSIWEIKHVQDDLLNFCRRGNVSLHSKGVCAHNSTKSGFPSKSFEDRNWLAKSVLNRQGPVAYQDNEWVTFKDQVLGKPFSVKTVERKVRMDFDMSRKPDRKSFSTVLPVLDGAEYEIANFSTVPFDSVAEYRKYRHKKKLCSVLRTMDDWAIFWRKLDMNSCGNHITDMAWSILVSCIMGYRSGKFSIPALDALNTVEEKCEWINRHNTSNKRFTATNWKNARRPERQSNMLPDELLMEKLMELQSDCVAS